MSYDALVIAAHPDDAETQMGGTVAKLADRGQRILLVDLTDGEPTEFAEVGIRAQQAEIYRSPSPLLVEDPTVFRPAIHG